MEDLFTEERPQELCKMCGRCCKVSTTASTYEELSSLKDIGNEDAKAFLSIFEPYSSPEEAKKTDESTVNNIFLRTPKEKHCDLTFYGCKYLSEDNLCLNYKNRPELCKRFPSSPWSIVPPGCGFEGWLFAQRERIKQFIRKEKEELLSLDVLLKEAPEANKIKIKERIEQINKHIKVLEKYGSKDW